MHLARKLHVRYEGPPTPSSFSPRASFSEGMVRHGERDAISVLASFLPGSAALGIGPGLGELGRRFSAAAAISSSRLPHRSSSETLLRPELGPDGLPRPPAASERRQSRFVQVLERIDSRRIEDPGV